MSNRRDSKPNRRSFLSAAAVAGGLSGCWALLAQDKEPRRDAGSPYRGEDYVDESPVADFPPRRDKIRITKLETMLVQPRWLFLKIHTDAGVVGWG